jgi:hypothetical protein
MLPTVSFVPDLMDVPRRLYRRGQTDRMKARAARLITQRSRHCSPMLAGSSFVNGVWIPRYHTQQGIQRIIGTQAAMHSTHVCGMCKYEKKYDIPHIKAHESVQIDSLFYFVQCDHPPKSNA